MEERLKTMTPEEREQFQARLKERGFGPDAMAGGRGSPGQPGRSAGPPSSVGQQGPRAVAAPSAQSAQTIDQLFGPLQLQITSGRAWRMIDGQLKMVRLQLGISDGTYTEIVSNDIQDGTEIVTSIDLGTASTAVRATTPFMPGGMGGRGGPGMGGPPGR